MRSNLVLSSAVALAFLSVAPRIAAAKSKPVVASDGSKKSGKEISTDDHALDKQMDWEAKVLGPNTQKKIDLAKIQKLQAEEMARREKQEKIDQAEKDRKDREAASAAAAQRNVKAPSTREVPEVPETPPPAKPAEKHDDAFVDKLLTGKPEKKKVAVSNDDVDQLLNKAKQEKPAGGSGKSRGKGGGDNVDQLLATADKQTAIKTTTRKPVDPTVEPVSAEAAAREATLKAIAAAAAKAQEERARNKRPAIPDAAMLRAQAGTKTPDGSRPSAARAGWTDPFANDSLPTTSSSGKGRNKGTPATTSSRMAPESGRRMPASRPASNDGWQDPFDSRGGGTKTRATPRKTAPAARPGKHPANWKDPFA